MALTSAKRPSGTWAFPRFTSKNSDPNSALSAFLQAVDLGKIVVPSYLIVENLDRISRDTVPTALALLESIVKRGITVVTLTDGKKYTAESIQTGLNDIMLVVLSFALAHEESLKKRVRQKGNWEAARKNAALGKKIKTAWPSWMTLRGNEFSLIPERVEDIRLMFSLFLDEGLGYKKIALRLNSMGKRTVNGLEWYPQIVKNILKNHALIGEFHPAIRKDGKREKTGDVIKNYFPPVVSETDFYAVQSKLSIHPPQKGKKTQDESLNLWDGLFRCGYCAGSMGLFGGKNLICWNSFNSRSCIRHSWNYIDFEIPLLLEMEEVMKERKSELNQPIRKELTALNAKIDDIVSRIEKLNFLAEKLDDPTETIKRINSLTKEKASIETQIKEKESLVVELEGIGSAALDIDGILMSGNRAERMQIQRLIRKHVNRIDVFPIGTPETNDEFRKQRDAILATGKGIHSANKTTVAKFQPAKRRYMEIHTRNPVQRGGVKMSCIRVRVESEAPTINQIQTLDRLEVANPVAA